MKKQPAFVITIFLSAALCVRINAQSTFSSVTHVLHTNCTASGCHNSADIAGNLDLSLSEPDLFSALINQTPHNLTAATKGNKLVAPGYVAKSYLYRIIAEGFDAMVPLDSAENLQAVAHQQLSAADRELIRQWIQYGASQNDTAVSLQTISDFHNGSGLPLLNTPPSPADEGKEGIQLRIGPILLQPGEEVEFFHKFKADLPGEKEVYRLEAIFDNYSHHFVIFDFKPSSAATYPEGLQDAGTYAAQFPIHLGAKEVDAFNESRNDVLPPGTAYFWDDTTTLVLDYHVRNYSSTQILGATAYINLYTREKQQGTREMKMEFPVYGFPTPWVLQIPPTGQPYKKEFSYTKPGEVWDVWKTQGHTHSLGTDFDVFLRNSDGTRGQQIYEGYYNSDYTFNQGFFDNQHAPVRTTDNPFVTVNMNTGIILEATWLNTGPDTVKFRLTTEDEMFAAYFTYSVKEYTTSILSPAEEKNSLSVYPNPSSGDVRIMLNDSESDLLSVRVYSMSGKLVYEKNGGRGNEFILPAGILQPGIFFVEANGRKQERTKLVIY